MALPETPSQTAGPFLHIGLVPGSAGMGLGPDTLGTDIAGPNAAGERIRIRGQVLDGLGAPAADALIEVWQANAAGIYAHSADPRAGQIEPGFRGWGRAVPDRETSEFEIATVKPGPVALGSGGTMAPHLSLWLVARGINTALQTRLYFADEAEANAADPVLARIPPLRRETLMAAPEAPGLYHFDIRLQGPGETVFLDV